MNNGAIGILGGTFDPIHLGHLHVARAVYEQLALQSMRFLPCGVPALRDTPMAMPEQRLAMVELAIAQEAGFCVDDREVRRLGPSYMVDTLCAMRSEVGKTPLCLVLALDALSGLMRWHKWQTLLDWAHLVVVGRPGYAMPSNAVLMRWLGAHQTTELTALQDAPAGFIMMLDQQIPSLAISATDIRAEIKTGRVPKGVLPEAVLEYIMTHHLYS